MFEKGVVDIPYVPLDFLWLLVEFRDAQMVEPFSISDVPSWSRSLHLWYSMVVYTIGWFDTDLVSVEDFQDVMPTPPETIEFPGSPIIAFQRRQRANITSCLL